MGLSQFISCGSHDADSCNIIDDIEILAQRRRSVMTSETVSNADTDNQRHPVPAALTSQKLHGHHHIRFLIGQRPFFQNIMLPQIFLGRL